MFRTVKLCKRQLQNIKYGSHVSTQQPQDTQEKSSQICSRPMHPKQINSRCVQHSLKYEPIALQEYEKIMFARKTPVKVLKTGFVVCMEMPFLGARSPDFTHFSSFNE